MHRTIETMKTSGMKHPIHDEASHASPLAPAYPPEGRPNPSPPPLPYSVLHTRRHTTTFALPAPPPRLPARSNPLSILPRLDRQALDNDAEKEDPRVEEEKDKDGQDDGVEHLAEQEVEGRM